MNEIVNMDAMKYIDTLLPESVDLIVLDPNYEQWDKFLSEGIIEKAIRVLKPSGNILCFTKQPFDYELRIAINDYFRREIVWTFENGGAWVSKQMPLVSFQKIYWLVKSKDFYFNPRTGKEYSKNTNNFHRTTKVFGDYCEEGKDFQKSEEGVWLRDHLHYNKPNCGAIPQKPRELIDIFLKCFCPDGGTVLDLFGGSGVVSIAAREHKLNSKSAELDKERADNIREKLNEPQQIDIFDLIGEGSFG